MPAEPSREDAWGLVPAIPDPPPRSQEIGVTTDSEDWGQSAPRIPSTARDDLDLLGRGLALVGLSKARYMILRHGWHMRKRPRL